MKRTAWGSRSFSNRGATSQGWTLSLRISYSIGLKTNRSFWSISVTCQRAAFDCLPNQQREHRRRQTASHKKDGPLCTCVGVSPGALCPQATSGSRA